MSDDVKISETIVGEALTVMGNLSEALGTLRRSDAKTDGELRKEVVFVVDVMREFAVWHKLREHEASMLSTRVVRSLLTFTCALRSLALRDDRASGEIDRSIVVPICAILKSMPLVPLLQAAESVLTSQRSAGSPPLSILLNISPDTPAQSVRVIKQLENVLCAPQPTPDGEGHRSKRRRK